MMGVASDDVARLKRHHVRLAVLGAAVLAMLYPAPAAWSHSASTPTRLLVKVRARIAKFGNYKGPAELAPRKVLFTPSVVNVGTVIIVVSNSDDDGTQFEINGVRSRRMGPGGKAVIRVTFKVPGIYAPAISVDDGVDLTGALTVVK